MKKILQHKKEIIISLITGIFIFYIQPLLEYLGTRFVWSFLFISEKFSNSYYQAISNNDLNAFSEWNSFLLNYLFSILSVIFVLYIINNRKKLQADINKTISSIIETKQQIEKIDSDETDNKTQTIEEILLSVTNLEAKAIFLKEKITKKDNNVIIISITTVFFIILLFSNYAINTSISKQNLIFRNDLIKIEPYIDNSIITKFKSDWARIENSKDFDIVKAKIDFLKKTYKIK